MEKRMRTPVSGGSAARRRRGEGHGVNTSYNVEGSEACHEALELRPCPVKDLASRTKENNIRAAIRQANRRAHSPACTQIEPFDSVRSSVSPALIPHPTQPKKGPQSKGASHSSFASITTNKFGRCDLSTWTRSNPLLVRDAGGRQDHMAPVVTVWMSLEELRYRTPAPPMGKPGSGKGARRGTDKGDGCGFETLPDREGKVCSKDKRRETWTPGLVL